MVEVTVRFCRLLVISFWIHVQILVARIVGRSDSTYLARQVGSNLCILRQGHDESSEFEAEAEANE
jgi:hypothetical protein